MSRTTLRRCCPVLLAIGLAAPAGAGPDVEPIDFAVTGGRSVPAERWTIEVPENRSDPDSRPIPLRFVRFAARTETPAAPIVYLAGGPGGAGTAAAAGPRFAMFDRLRDVADVIILDQRGTGLSDSMPGCVSSVTYPADEPLSRDVVTRLHRAALEECVGSWAGEGVDIRGYTTRESVADIEAVRSALGAERVSLLGISYGTHLALATMSAHPDHVERAVLVSPEGLDETVKLPSRTDAYFDRLQAAIDADPDAKARYPDIKATIRAAVERLERETPTVTIQVRGAEPTEVVLHPFVLQLLIGWSIADPERVTPMLNGVTNVAAGDDAWIRFALSWSGTETIELNGMSTAMDIASGITRERLAQVRAEAGTSLLGDALNFPMPHLDKAIEGLDLGDDFRAPCTADVPTLLFSGTLDGRTYIESHRELDARLPDSRLVVVEHAGHNLFFAHPDIVGTIVRFFAGEPVEAATITAPRPSF